MQNDSGKIQISEEIASVMFPDKNAVHSGRLIRSWSNFFIQHKELPVSQQGRFVKVPSLIHDEDIQAKLRIYIRSLSENALTSSSLALWVRENLHKEMGWHSPVVVSDKTCQRWLNILGLIFGRYQPGLYNDGHERADVVEYRKKFLLRFEEYETRMTTYDGEFMQNVHPPPLDSSGQRPLVLVTHDESCFSSNDGRNFIWLDQNNRPIRPKGSGRSIMVSAFLCECHGLLKLNESGLLPDVPLDSTVILKPGANNDGYWRNCDLVSQLKEKAIPIFKALHPDADGLFMFDNSQNHHAKPPDALNANKINLNDGGRQSVQMRAGYFTRDGQRVVQSMADKTGKPSVMKQAHIYFKLRAPFQSRAHGELL